MQTQTGIQPLRLIEQSVNVLFLPILTAMCIL